MIRLFNGDCIKVMEKLAGDGIKVDAIIADPPYGVTHNKWDTVIPLDLMWGGITRVSKDTTPIILTSQSLFTAIRTSGR